MKHFDAAQQAFRTFQLDRALEHLERVLELAPNLRRGAEWDRQSPAKAGGHRARQLAYQTAKAGGRLFAALRGR